MEEVGILRSVYDPADTIVEPRGRHGLKLIKHQPEHVRAHYRAPGFHLACVYHPEVCLRPRLLIKSTNRHYHLQRPGALRLHDQSARGLSSTAIDPVGLASMLGFGYHLGDVNLPHVHVEFRASTDRFAIERYWNYPYGGLGTGAADEVKLAEALHRHLARTLKRRLHILGWRQ
jgi:hypothetical protein